MDEHEYPDLVDIAKYPSVDPIDSDENSHHHYYRHDINDWWCREDDTVTDFCTGD